VGYVGQARLFLDGRVIPDDSWVGLWTWTEQGMVAKYPLFFPIVLAPLMALAPGLTFVVGLAAAVGLAFGVARVLDDWIDEPAWGLLVFAYPTVVLLSRTVMTDLVLCWAALAAWWSMRRDVPLRTFFLIALTVLAKPTGLPLALALVLGEAWQRRRAGTGFQPVWAACLGIAAGAFAAAALNIVTTGTPWYAYQSTHDGKDLFSLAHVMTSGFAHARTLLVFPPLLVAGVLVLWRRQAIGPLLATAACVTLMSCFFFVDTGPGTLDSLVVSPRLILPAVVFLLLGYSELLSILAARLRVSRVVPWLLVVMAAGAAVGVGVAQSRLHAPMRDARRAAERVFDQHGGRLGLTFDAFEAGALSDRPLEFWPGGEGGPCVVLCNTGSYSYRSPEAAFCSFVGYELRAEVGTYRVLVRTDCGINASSRGSRVAPPTRDLGPMGRLRPRS
jgi:hypothetical protein